MTIIIMKNLIVLSLVLFLFPGCNENAGQVRPDIRLSSLKVMEGDVTEKTIEVNMSLSAAAPEEITLNFFTADSTATAGEDYVAVKNGTVIIPAGSSSHSFPLIIKGDDILEFSEIFLLHFTEPPNASLVFDFITVEITDDDEYELSRNEEGFISPESYESLKRVWSEEFDGPEINSDNWTFELGATGWGNQELQNYTKDPENAYIDNGKLIIKAIKTGPDSYTSARMITKDKREFQFGRIDIRARLPQGQGIWPAIWMLGHHIDDVGWPSCGEIDIMELVGHEPYKVHGTAHFNKNGHTYMGSSYIIDRTKTFGDEFHVFSIMWEKGRIRWFVDYNKFYEITTEMVGSSYPFNNDFFFILNIAVGGVWPGYPDETTTFPQTMEIDYIRVFQQD